MEPGPTFEDVLAELSTRFTGVPADRVDAEIQGALRELAGCLDTDRATLLEFSPDGDSLRPTHSWARPPLEPYLNPLMRQEVPWYCEQLLEGHVVRFERLPADLPEAAAREREYASRSGMQAQLTVPVAVGGRFVCALATAAFRAPRAWPDATVARLRTAGQILAHAIHRKRTEAELQQRLAEVQALQARLEAENVYLREEVDHAQGFDEVVGRSPALRKVLAQVAQVAPTGAAVLLLGETGTGKELMARALHERSPRRRRPLVRVNCAALPPTLIESELFGHERGAFTGATSARPGRFELADGGTLFLDEIGELPVDMQPKLLRVLERGEFERVGGTRTLRVDVRIVAATNRDLSRAIAEGRFREDLYYRLAAFPIVLPPLRERREDIPLLVWALLERHQADLGRRIERVPRPVMDALVRYAWPGNVRELQHVIERALILSPGPALQVEASFAAGGRVEGGAGGGLVADRLEEVARAHILRVLERCGWLINGPGNAAERLGLHPNTLRSRMNKLGIARPQGARRSRAPAPTTPGR
jgi:transcriptional regulator with GAF, ATPase, and Fis domain